MGNGTKWEMGTKWDKTLGFRRTRSGFRTLRNAEETFRTRGFRTLVHFAHIDFAPLRDFAPSEDFAPADISHHCAFRTSGAFRTEGSSHQGDFAPLVISHPW